MNSKQSGRRRFLKNAALAGLAVGSIRSVSGQTPVSETPGERPLEANLNKLRSVAPSNPRKYGVRSRFDTSIRLDDDHGPDGVVTPLQDLGGIITPSGLHFQMEHTNCPEIDPRQHRLLIHGLVDRPLIFTMEELKYLPSVSRIHFIECNGNSQPRGDNLETVQKMHGRTSCSEWTGVLLSLLLKEVGVQKAATWLVAEGADDAKFTETFPMEKAMADVLVAYAQNGEAIRPEQGYPLRLVIPGWEGNISVKWLRRIKVGDQPYMPKHQMAGNAEMMADGKARWFNFEMGVQSVITFPSGRQRLPGRGFYEITGLAWSGGGAVRRVEVSTDGGRSWKDAQLQEPVLRMAHTRFRFPWNWDGEEAVLQSRCTDDRGEVQPTLAEMSKVWGVSPSYFQSNGNHFNAIHPWKVTRDGSVQNALLFS